MMMSKGMLVTVDDDEQRGLVTVMNSEEGCLMAVIDDAAVLWMVSKGV